MSIALVGDIGGTNARFGLWRKSRLESIRVFETASFENIEHAVEHYLHSLAHDRAEISQMALACAGPIQGEHFRFTNNHWHLSRSSLCRRFSLSRLVLLNDFAATALGVTHLGNVDYLPLRQGRADSTAPIVVIGAGTGLGVATLVPASDGTHTVLAGEGGHIDLPLGDDQEIALWREMKVKQGRVQAEDVLSGRGLLQLYQAVCAIERIEPRFTSPEAVSAAALAGDPGATKTLERFCIWLGRVAGNNVLTLGARGGVYIAGGIVPRFASFVASSGFTYGFSDGHRMADYLDQVPVWLVTAEFVGLEGAGIAIDSNCGK
ncbi:glucokinase [Halopseudomonas salegens]|uniref:Glucokinase n=1 Tax=Halopseudomonas salegens TaxID=1434072 RepID=A0A1H2E4Y3_9GAMM|nr:glucokinase [Halopseudomonas salegens]SDT90094.1 glucokinase [Halopseudomonas salegens]